MDKKIKKVKKMLNELDNQTDLDTIKESREEIKNSIEHLEKTYNKLTEKYNDIKSNKFDSEEDDGEELEDKYNSLMKKLKKYNKDDLSIDEKLKLYEDSIMLIQSIKKIIKNKEQVIVEL